MTRRITFLFLVPLLVVASIAHAAPDVALPPIKVVKGVKAKRKVFKAATRKKPLVIRSAKDAAMVFSKTALARLKKQVDFKQQFVLVFAWKGSGQDRLTYNVAESFPEQVFFNYKPGRTRDLRPHVSIFVLRANVKWKM